MASQTKNGTGAEALERTAGRDLRDLALSYLAGGVSLVPCSPSTKRPDGDLLPKDEEGKPTWKPYQDKPATAAAVKLWTPPPASIGSDIIDRAARYLQEPKQRQTELPLPPATEEAQP
jgi:hypothetical protein